MRPLVNKANSIFPKLSDHFCSLIKNQESDLHEIPSISIKESDNHHLHIEAFGKTIEIKFSMITYKEQIFYGQLNAKLIKKADGLFPSETSIYSLWFDQHGNVRDELADEHSLNHINDRWFLVNFIENVLEKLLLSEEFKAS